LAIFLLHSALEGAGKDNELAFGTARDAIRPMQTKWKLTLVASAHRASRIFKLRRSFSVIRCKLIYRYGTRDEYFDTSN